MKADSSSMIRATILRTVTSYKWQVTSGRTKLPTLALLAIRFLPPMLVTCHLSLIRGPSVLANQWHKLAGAMLFDLIASFRLDHAHQTLRLARFANRNHQAASDLQLRDQSIGHARSAGRDQNSLVRRMRAPTERAVKSLDRRIVDPKFANAGLRLARKFADAFNRVNLRARRKPAFANLG